MIRSSVLVFLTLLLHLGAAEENCDDNSIGWTLQDPEDCHGYFLCHSGFKLQQYCAPGMKYEKEIRACVIGKCPPCNCADSPSTETTPNPSNSSTTTETSSTSESTESTTVSSSTQSTTEDSSTSESTESTTISSSTQSTTEASSTSESTESTTISSSTQSTSPATNSTTDSSTSDSTSVSSSSSQSSEPSTEPIPTPTPSNPNPAVSCVNIPDGSFFADRVHCRDYYVCRNGQPVLLHCQKGTWFDDVNFVCNFRHLVNCPANID